MAGQGDWSLPESLRPLLGLSTFGVADCAVDVGTDQVGLEDETGHGGWNLCLGMAGGQSQCRVTLTWSHWKRWRSGLF